MNGPLTLLAGRLRIELFRQGDRYAHRLAIDAGSVLLPLAASDEGSADEAWPASPPFQELQLEQRPAGCQVALLVGMAGASHWSASIEADPASERLTFDVACRLRGPAGRLGSRYRLDENCLAQQTPSGLRIAAGPAAEVLFEVDPAAAAAQCGIVLMGGIVVAEPAAAPSAGSRTVRWKYTVRGLPGPPAAPSIGP